MNKDSRALLFLNSIDGMTQKRLVEALPLFDGPDELTGRLREKAERLIAIWGAALYDEVTTLNNEDYKRSLETGLRNIGASFISFLDAEYPVNLKEISDFPTMLFYKGDIEILKGYLFSVVGTRAPSAYGKRVAKEFCEELAKAGFTIVSGMARGIDTVAHRAAIDNGMPTIAVLGTGIDVVYPAENRGLSEEISKNGLILTEYCPKTPPMNYHFPHRNRIISALSSSVLVPEAGENSGSLITINYAVEQGKNVYIVPGNIYSPESRGANNFLKKYQGAIVTDINDILEDHRLPKKNRPRDGVELDFFEAMIVGELEKGDRHFDELLALTGLQINKLNAILLSLVMMGQIDEIGNNYYSYA